MLQILVVFYLVWNLLETVYIIYVSHNSSARCKVRTVGWCEKKLSCAYMSSSWIWKGVSAILQVAYTPFHIQGDYVSLTGKGLIPP